jgi:rhodanese-related sulfurtransferase
VNVRHNEAGEKNEERKLNAMNLQVGLDMHHRRAGATRAASTLSNRAARVVPALRERVDLRSEIGRDMKKGYKQLVDEANAQIKTYSVAEAQAKLGDPQVQFIDVRDIRELEREGIVPGAFHAPRGMIEFWVDPDSPYFKPVFGENKEFILFCAAGWRSALTTKTVQDMGLENVAHIDGGFGAWKAAGALTAVKESKKA